MLLLKIINLNTPISNTNKTLITNVRVFKSFIFYFSFLDCRYT